MRCHWAVVLAIVTSAAAQAADPAAASAGRALYNRSCTMCHGLDGAAGDRAPALGAQRRYLRASEADLFNAIQKGIAGTAMPASSLAADDIHKIVAFIRSLRATAGESGAPGDARAGEAIFHGKGGCVACHVMRGRGGILGPDLSTIGGERRLEDLRSALTVAKPAPPRGYQPVTVLTKSGERIEGIARNEHNSSIQVLGKDQKLHLLTAEEIDRIERSEKSWMPADAAKKLAPGELQNLLAFLASLSGPGGNRRRAQ